MGMIPNYSQINVGVIPEDWEYRIFGHIFAKPSRNGIYKTSEYQGCGTRIVNMGEMFGFEFISDQDMSRVMLTTQELAANRLQDGDLLFGRRSVVPTGAGKCSLIVSPTEPIIFESSIIRVKLDKTRACPKFYYYYFASAIGRSNVSTLVSGTTITGIRATELRELKVPFPPTKAEQEAIAETLFDVDDLIGSLERLLAKKRNLKQATVQELLAGTRRLPGFSGAWNTKQIAEIASPSAEKNSSANHLPVLTCSKHLGFVDSIGYFKNQVFSKDTSGYKVIRRGQIGYPSNHIEEGSIGLQDIYDVALVSPIYVVFSVKEGINSYFLHRLLKLDSYRQRFETATNASVNRRGSLRWPAFSQITVSLPSIAEQSAIATILIDMDDELTMLESKVAKARQIKLGMMHNLLTGRIRLV